MEPWLIGILRPTRRLGESSAVVQGERGADALCRSEIGLDDAWKKRDAELKGQ
jgi:hypothetical protein